MQEKLPVAMHPEKLPVAMHPEKLPVAMHPEKLPVAGSVGGRFGWWQVRLVAGSLYIGMEC